MASVYEIEAAAIASLQGDGEGEMRLIVEMVAQDTGVEASEILGARKLRKTVRARQLAMWAGREAGLTLTEIGAVLNRDHTTILHGIKAVGKRMKETNQ